MLAINNKQLKREFCIRYLGILIDSHLNWKHHVECIAKGQFIFYEVGGLVGFGGGHPQKNGLKGGASKKNMGKGGHIKYYLYWKGSWEKI